MKRASQGKTQVVPASKIRAGSLANSSYLHRKRCFYLQRHVLLSLRAFVPSFLWLFGNILLPLRRFNNPSA